MKILVLCYEYPPVGGGGGRVAASVAEGLVRHGHEVRVVSAGLRHLPHEAVVNGVAVLRPQSFRRREDTCSVPEMALYLLTAFFPAWNLCRTWKPDVIHAHFVVPTAHWLSPCTNSPASLMCSQPTSEMFPVACQSKQTPSSACSGRSSNRFGKMPPQSLP